MESLSISCTGESHKSTSKPCQDYSYDFHSPGLTMAIVCDGHGGERYFRSHYGAKFATEITAEAIRQFVKNTNKNANDSSNKHTPFAGAPFTAYSEATSTIEKEDTPAHKALMWLFSSIISQWNDAIAKHARENDLNEWELEHVEQKYKDRFQADRAKENATFEKTYGCTLMVYVRTREYWLAFHIGDGKCLRFTAKDDHLIVDQPIPWDDRCFLNKTTSLCDSDALPEFRYCYEGDGNFPTAMCLGSDGIDDSYGDGDNLTNFYIEIYKEIAINGKKKAKIMLERDLPIISQKGSKDDMSVAIAYDEHQLNDMFPLLIGCQLDMLQKQQDKLRQKYTELYSKVALSIVKPIGDRKAQIELQYAKSDLEKVNASLTKIKSKLGLLKTELDEFESKIKKHK